MKVNFLILVGIIFFGFMGQEVPAATAVSKTTAVQWYNKLTPTQTTKAESFIAACKIGKCDPKAINGWLTGICGGSCCNRDDHGFGTVGGKIQRDLCFYAGKYLQ